MAQVTKIRLVDDLDGGNADESVDFTIDNNSYQMDLSETNAGGLREAPAPFIAAARRAGASTTTRTRRSTIASRPAGAGKHSARFCRELIAGRLMTSGSRRGSGRRG